MMKKRKIKWRTYFHQLEIIFEDVFFASIYFNGWHTNTERTVIEMPDNDLCKELNIRFQIEQGYQMFIIHPEDYKNDIYVAAKSISYNADKVYYYNKQNLKPSERIADFVKKQK